MLPSTRKNQDLGAGRGGRTTEGVEVMGNWETCIFFWCRGFFTDWGLGHGVVLSAFFSDTDAVLNHGFESAPGH